jgi:hypothetical protein
MKRHLVSGQTNPGIVKKRRRYIPCIEPGCETVPRFNERGLKQGLYCASHKKFGMINVADPPCIEPGCDTQPCYNDRGLKKALCCAKHKKFGMINIKHPPCIEPGCETRPIYNIRGSKKRLYCVTHKKLGMINIQNPPCIEPACETRPTFNNRGLKRGLYCAKHKKLKMINIQNQLCIEPGCESQPAYNNCGLKNGLYCVTHKKLGMINIKHPPCIEPGCQKQPAYNNCGLKKRLYCAEHKNLDMINVKDRPCIEPGCKTQPAYNNCGLTNRLYCAKHKKLGMINVKDTPCIHTGCETLPTYNYPGLAAAVCYEHRKPGMISKPKRKCEVDQCTGYAHYGIRSIPERCENHKNALDRDLVLKRCVGCLNPETDLVDELCSTCSGRFVRIRLGRQKQVLAHFNLCPELKNPLKSYDKALDRVDSDFKTCGKERPDFLFDAMTHYVIVEVDERQHESYVPQCDEMRMKNITQALQRPCIWIRYNPDEYKGLSEKIRDRHRLDHLERVLKHALDLTPQSHDDVMRVTYLFFDHFKMTDPLKFTSIHCV